MMSEHVDGWIPELVLGTLDRDVRAAVEVHLRGCRRCADEAAATEEALSLLALALPTEPPPTALRTGLLTAVAEEQKRREQEAERGRFAPFIDRVARFFDVTGERARGLVALLDDPLAWMPGPARGVELIHIDAGARFAAADAGFVRMAPGARFPRHRHIGQELGLILEGGFTDEDGSVLRAGELHSRAAGTTHDFVALPEGCLFAALVDGGIEFLGRG